MDEALKLGYLTRRRQQHLRPLYIAFEVNLHRRPVRGSSRAVIDVGRPTQGVHNGLAVGQAPSHHTHLRSGQVPQIGVWASQHRYLLSFARQHLCQPATEEPARTCHQRWHALLAPHLVEGIQYKLEMFRRMGCRHTQSQARRSLGYRRK